MRFFAPVTAAIGFFALANAAPTPLVAKPQTSPNLSLLERASLTVLTSYSGESCSSLAGAVPLVKNVCLPLVKASKSLKISGTALASGCVVYGYSTRSCGGYNNIFVLGPSTSSQCYKTLPDPSGSGLSTILSVKMQC